MIERWEEIFEPSPVPGWLAAFDEDPAAAVDQMLWGRFYFGHLQAAEPEDLLIDWANLLGDEGDFVARLDQALASWFDYHWGKFPPNRKAKRLADAWSRLSEIVTCVEDLKETPTRLWAKLDEAPGFLQPLSVSPSRDPFGRFLGAVAEHQPRLLSDSRTTKWRALVCSVCAKIEELRKRAPHSLMVPKSLPLSS